MADTFFEHRKTPILADWLNDVNEAVYHKLPNMVSVRDFGAVGDGVANDTLAFEAAEATGKTVYVPSGTYAINWTVGTKLIVVGDGSTTTLLKPFDTALAAVTYTSTAPYWTYHSEFRGIGFQGTGKVGIGFTFAKTNPTDYATGDEYANNVRFYGCNFRGFHKGIQFPFGNIGTEFYSCNFQSNFYGVYMLNNKFGSIMHAGNKYFYGGEISVNDCGVYCHNTADGFGGLVFENTIFEYNAINTYVYTNNTYTPIKFDGCWNEGSGTLSTTPTVLLDQWSGATLSTLSFNSRAFVFDGTSSRYSYARGGATDFYVKGTNIQVNCVECTVERGPGFGGAESTVDSATSKLVLVNPITDGGVTMGANIVCVGGWQNRNTLTISGDSIRAQARKALIPHRFNKQASYGGMTGSVSMPLTTVANFGSGSFGPIAGTVVNDSPTYATCNEWVLPFSGTPQYVRLQGSECTMSDGHYVMTVALKLVSGDARVFVWDRSSVHLGDDATLPVGSWVTLAMRGYSPGGQTVYLDITSQDGAPITLRGSAFQIHRFDTQLEADLFLASDSYVTT